MKNFKFAVLAMMIIGAMFGTGCSDLSQGFHEKAGVIIPTISPQILKATSTGTSEAEIYASGTFPTATIMFQNLNAIPVVLKAYKVDYFSTTDGSQIGSLTFSGQTVFTVPGATGEATTTTTTTTTTDSSSGLTLYLWTQAVKDEVYGNTSISSDNKQLLAKIDIYGDDYNGNSVQISAAVTLTP
jgi:hypothetical protein